MIGRQQIVRPRMVKERAFAGSGHRHDVCVRRRRSIGSMQLLGVDPNRTGMLAQEIAIGIVAEQADGIDRHGRVEFAHVYAEIVGGTTSLSLASRDPGQFLLFGPLVYELDAIDCPGATTDETASLCFGHDINTGSVIFRSSRRGRCGCIPCASR